MDDSTTRRSGDQTVSGKAAASCRPWGRDSPDSGDGENSEVCKRCSTALQDFEVQGRSLVLFPGDTGGL